MKRPLGPNLRDKRVPMSQASNVVRLAVANPAKEPATYEQVRDTHFEPLKERVGGPTFEQSKLDHGRLDEFGIAVRMALMTMGKTKPELIKMVRAAHARDVHAGAK